MGLVDIFNTYEGQQGLGLLAAASARSDGAGFGQRLQEGLGMADNWKRKKAQDEFQQMQMMEMKSKMEEQQKLRQLASKFYIPASQGVPAYGAGDKLLPPHLQTGVSGDAIPARPASYDYQGLANAMAEVSPLAAMDLHMKLQKDTTPITVKEGEILLDRNTRKPIYTAPSKPVKDDSKVTQFEYAKATGYKGTFDQFLTLGPSIMAAAVAPLRDAQIGNINAENAYNLPPPRRTVQTGAVSVTTPQGTFTFPDQKAANNFKMKAGIK